MNISKGSTSNGYVAYYAKKVYTGDYSEDENFVYMTRDSKMYIVDYIGSSKNVVVPENCEIDDYAFYNRSDLLTVVISSKVTSIGQAAFAGTRLKSLTVGSGITTIASDAFANNSSPVKTIWLTNTPPTYYQTASGTVNYASNTNFSSLSNISVYKYLSSMFTVGGVKYAMNNTSECDAIDCVYDEEAAHVSIGSTVTYRNRQLNVKEVKPYACYQNQFIEETNISNQGNIGNYAFTECQALSAVTVNNKGYVGDYAFQECTALQTAALGDEVTEFKGYVFNGCSSLEGVTIPDGIAQIGDFCFNNCSKLGFVHIGSGISTLNDYMFSGCSLLPEIVIPATVNNIGNNVFTGCTHLADVILADGDNTLTIGRYSGSYWLSQFIDCELDSVYIGRKLSYDYSPFWYNTTLRSVVIGDQEVKVYDFEFEGCSGLTDVVLGEALTTIGINAFLDCRNLQGVTIPNQVSTLNNRCFLNCESLKYVAFGTKVSSIGSSTFSGCKSLTEISIPQTVTSVGQSAFEGCTSLANVFIEDRETSLSLSYNGSNKPLFSDCPLDSVYIGGKITYNKTSSYGYSPFYRNLSLRSVVITDVETEVYDNEFYGCTNLTNVKIGDGVTTIGNWAFSGCSNLDYLAFGSGMQSIGQEAFSDCAHVTSIYSKATVPPVCGSQALEDINIWDCTLYVPMGTVEDYAMADQWEAFFFAQEYDYENEEDIVIPQYSLVYTTTDEQIIEPLATAFGNAVLMQNVYKNGHGILTFDGEVTTLGASAFAGCSTLRTINFPATVTAVGSAAFAGCTVLERIAVGSTETPAAAADAFDDVTCQKAVLIVPAEAEEDYKAHETWGRFWFVTSNTKPVIKQLNDADTQYSNPVYTQADFITYTRTFNNTNWQALYVPFELEYDDWAEDFDVAQINNIHLYDDDQDGEADRTVVEAFTVHSGSLEANYPYLIRAHQTGSKVLKLQDAMLYRAEERRFECNSMSYTYTFTGTYHQISGATMMTNGSYALGGGNLIRPESETANLGAYRWYLDISGRNGNVRKARTIAISVDDEMVDTGIETIAMEGAGTSAVYTLDGLRAHEWQKGLQIRNGKVVYIK